MKGRGKGFWTFYEFVEFKDLTPEKEM
jgi:hypothetical protein